MMNHGSTTIVGNLTDDLELRYTPSGVALAKGSIAINYSKKNASGDWENDPSFISFTMWRELAEFATESLKKGNRVIAVGRIVQERWQTDTGENRSRVVLQVDDIAPSVRFNSVSVHAKPVAANSGSGGGYSDYGPDEAPF